MSSPASGLEPGPPPCAFALDKDDAEALTEGKWLGRGSEAVVHGAALDSRLATRGCLFACLPGVNADGHDFAEAAVRAGAALVLASRELRLPVPVLVVRDVATALVRLATEFRRRHRGAIWIGVTGSNGKTTTKELIAAACAGEAAARSARVHATRGNLNNRLGVPLTVFATPAEAAFAVIEMGASGPGEIAELAGIARPDVGVITALGPAHLQGFGDLIGVARGKSELFAALPPGGTALIGVSGLDAVAGAYGCRGEDLVAEARARAAARRLVLVGSQACPVEGEAGEDAVTLRVAAGSARIELIGRHNLANAALAYHAAVAAGVAPARALAGLAAVKPVGGRLRRIALGRHVLLDDSYNANPASMIAGLQALAARSGAKLAILGAMGELGAGVEAGHVQVGAEAARLGLPLITVGDGAIAIADGYRDAGGGEATRCADRPSAVTAALARLAAAPATVLVKASRSSGLETVVEGLTAALRGAEGKG